MAQQVKIAGALFNDVPSISVPDNNNVYHPFVDTSDANATAEDIASGKTAYVNGAKVTGTGSGGSPIINSLNVTQNGTYTAPSGVDGYSPVTVNVSGGGGISFQPESDGKNHYKFLITDITDATIAIPMSGAGTIDWGDGNTETVVGGTNYHTYDSIGMFDVSTSQSIMVWNNTIYLPYRYRGKLVSAEVIRTSGTYQLAETYGLLYAYFQDGSITQGNYLCQNAYAMRECRLANDITSIGSNAFDYCYSLNRITIPSGVTAIGENAFRYCRSLTSVTIPKSVASIGANAFRYCNSLTEYHVLATTPPTIGSNALQTPSGCKIYVPSGYLSAYQSAWSNYASYLEEE